MVGESPDGFDLDDTAGVVLAYGECFFAHQLELPVASQNLLRVDPEKANISQFGKNHGFVGYVPTATVFA